MFIKGKKSFALLLLLSWMVIGSIIKFCMSTVVKLVNDRKIWALKNKVV